ncbi:hypothetical protein V474_07560 [Novosphingobium barchaimii LL02]|uniref:Uncharacterized protein n=1 Tax=Novosphingobium barchaimii LL02 TaxID=1114963 RepID=A0A0J7Y9F4_9SPHN|nr:hypothetical protein [Novosphingobium barchaimii]KMS59958.1 hypothetical protein V474_07560 [Novosphingobium barchaimii LL02]
MRTALERYVKGSFVFLDRDIKELGSKKPRSDMQGFWEFRSQGPMTETRLFGFFARQGAFVATSFRARDEFVEDESEWLHERESSQKLWDGLTGGAAYLVAPWPVRTRAHLKEYTG